MSASTDDSLCWTYFLQLFQFKYAEQIVKFILIVTAIAVLVEF